MQIQPDLHTGGGKANLNMFVSGQFQRRAKLSLSGANIGVEQHPNVIEANFAQVYPGTVMIEFTLHDNGRIESPPITGNTLNDELGRFFLQALTSGAPGQPWPTEARQALGRDSIRIKAAFYYNRAPKTRKPSPASGLQC